MDEVTKVVTVRALLELDAHLRMLVDRYLEVHPPNRVYQLVCDMKLSGAVAKDYH